jgi:RND family efflux transporter MFP subunit
MLNKARHGGLALAVFILLTAVFLWLSGTFSSGKPPVLAEAADTPPAGKDEHDPAPGQSPTLNLAEIEAKTCEHHIRQLECNECRYELGVVKVAPSVTAALVATGKAQTREVVRKLRVTGEVRFDETRVVDVTPLAAGRITTIKARLGQPVKQGDVLAIIHCSDFGEAKATYLEAATTHQIAASEQIRQAAVNAALAKLLERLNQLKTAGHPESVGDLAGDVKQPLGEWRSKLIGAAARLQKARAVHEREKNLLSKQASSKADYEEALREFQTAQAELDALVEEVQLSPNLTQLKADNAARQAEAKMNAAKQRLHLFGLDDQAVANIGHATENGSFAHLEIKAPRDGTITAQSAAQGRFVDTAHVLFTIADPACLWVWCDVYEHDLEALHDKLAKDHTAPAIITVPAFPNTPFAGTVDLLGDTLDEHTRTIKARVQLANPQGKLRPGMFATVQIDLPTGLSAILVPRNAVLSDEGVSFAFEYWKEDLWLKREVTVGRAQDDLVEVTGIQSGATLATGGAFLLKSDILRAKMGAGCAD